MRIFENFIILYKNKGVFLLDLHNLFSEIREHGNASRVSEATGISTGNISDWKNGRAFPTATKLVVLADYFGCSIDYLLGRTENREIATVNNIVSDSTNSVAGNNNTVSVSSVQPQQDSMIQQMNELFNKLTFSDKLEIMRLVDEKAKNYVLG